MPEKPPSSPAETDTDLLTLPEAQSLVSTRGGALAELFAWVSTYPMNGHAALGRTGAVCPFTPQARRLDTVRLGVCGCGPEDAERAFAVIRKGFVELGRIPAKRGTEQFRTVIIAFPDCNSEAGIAMIESAMRRHRYYAMLRFRMMGFMHPFSESQGLWNPEFRPLRAPMPVLAIRYLVEQDAPFIANQHLQWGPYLLRFGIPGARRLMAWRRGRTKPAGTAVG